MAFSPWVLIAMNVVGVVIMVRYGPPKEVPFLGREDADPVFGYIGLVLFGSSIGIRVALTFTA